ncbi:hypothetical protein F0562_009994 [Nyssa sinensis]|uniref:Uncharacterized protein n=1 Tax=Nyssa sinensis TaxID=561372 RepID=A0A5J5A2B6_9ASTE|nr:hypothetical protein F0562_009994 [Nyssa sinensis]
MAHKESCNTISENNNFSSPCRSQVAEGIGNCSIENQINPNNPPIQIWNHEQNQLDFINFSISPERLAEVVEGNNIQCLQQYGGINGIATALETNLLMGIGGDREDLYRRHKAFGSNLNLEEKPSVLAKGLYRLVLDSLKDTTIILLLCCATLSLVIGIKRNGLEEALLDGAIIFLAILMFVNLGAIFRFCKARRIKKLSRGKNVVGVMRSGKTRHIPVSEIVVGDVVCLLTGDRVPADGLFIHGDSLKLDDDSVHEDHNYYSKCPSIFTGAKVAEGDCRMLVTSIGGNTEKGKLMRSISCHQREESKLQAAIDKTNSRLEKIWLSLLLLALVVQVLRCFVWKSDQCDENHDPDPKGVKNAVEEIMKEAAKLVKRQGVRINGLVAVLCILISALRDGLPLGLLISFAYASKKMMVYHAMVQKLPACATIGLVTTICTGETGDLGLQHMKIAELWIGFHNLKEASDMVADHEVLNALREGVCMNKSGPEEDTLLLWAHKVLGLDIEGLERSCTVLHSEASDINSDRRGISLRRDEDGGEAVHHWKGTPEIILSMCSDYYNIDGTKQILDEDKRAMFKKLIEGIESDCLQCFAFAYKKLVIQEKEKPDLKLEEEEEEENYKPTESGLTLLGLVGLKNPYPPEVRQAIEACRESGVKIKLVVGDNINLARFMATNSHILRPEEDVKGAVIEASEFRNTSEEDRMKMIDKIRVMANTFPADKLSMVQCLRRKGEVVAVTGTCSRDSSSLKEADVGLCMGDNSAEAAKESSDIVILDLNFVTIYEILKLGRCVCNNLKKLIQSQLILNIAAFYINLILVVSTSEVPLSPFQLLWVNLIMDALGALGMAASVSDPPPSDQIQFGGAAGPLITKTMWRNVVFQSLYQVTVLLILDLKGKAILDEDEKVAAIEIPAVVIHAGRLNPKQWCICVGIAALSLPIGWATRCASFSAQAL